MRVTNINDVNLNLFPFDYDLTLAILLAHPDGTVYHRYGGRTTISPMNMETLLKLMNQGLETHNRYSTNPFPPKLPPKQTLRGLIQSNLKGRIKPVHGCYHCHYVREAHNLLDLEAKKWTPDKFWIWPDPKRLGLIMDQLDQNRIKEVVVGSPADEAGVHSGDELFSLGENRILTKYDIQWILETQPNEAISLNFVLKRKNKKIQGQFDLEMGWKVGNPDDYLWRISNQFTEHMSKFLPAPGFIGDQLKPHELASLGLETTSFALKVTQFNLGAHLGGIRKGDIVFSAGNKDDFKSIRDFHYWWELMRRLKTNVKIKLIRRGRLMQIMYSSQHLNYLEIEKPPQALLGFIAQQLPGHDGVRVGHVESGSGADEGGLKLGDRLLKFSQEKIQTVDQLEKILNNKVPGELIDIEIRRDQKILNLVFALQGQQRSSVDFVKLSSLPQKEKQKIECVVTLNIPQGKHIYSAFKKGFGLPTTLDFRGEGFELIGDLQEPPPRQVKDPQLEAMWILENKPQFRQTLRVTDPEKFKLVLKIFAQICDESHCQNFEVTAENRGQNLSFKTYTGNFENLPKIQKK